MAVMTNLDTFLRLLRQNGLTDIADAVCNSIQETVQHCLQDKQTDICDAIKQQAIPSSVKASLQNALTACAAAPYATPTKPDSRHSSRSTFAKFGIPVGSKLTFRRDCSIVCVTSDSVNHVCYAGQTLTISALAKQLTGWPSANGFNLFLYNNTRIIALPSQEQHSDVLTAPDIDIVGD